jgi:hypothetical protein
MRKEYKWSVKNSLEISKKYRGEHITIVGNKIVAHGKDFKKVAKEARKVYPNPLFAEIPKEDVVVYYDRILI